MSRFRKKFSTRQLRMLRQRFQQKEKTLLPMMAVASTANLLANFAKSLSATMSCTLFTWATTDIKIHILATCAVMSAQIRCPSSYILLNPSIKNMISIHTINFYDGIDIFGRNYFSTVDSIFLLKCDCNHMTYSIFLQKIEEKNNFLLNS